MADKIIRNKYIALSLIVGAVYFFLKFLCPLLAPILIAALFLTMFYPMLDDIQKKTHIKKQFLAVIFIIFFGILIAVAAWILITVIMQFFPVFADSVDDFQVQINIFIHECCSGLENIFGADTIYIEELIIEKINILVDDFQGQVLPQLLDHSWGYAQSLISMIGFIGITVIATVLLAKDYDEILDKMAVEAGSRMALEVVVRVILYIATFIKAQLIIMLVIGGLAMSVLGFSGVEYGVLWGLLAGILDVLPFIGTGIVLIPLAVWQLIQGMYLKAAACVILYIACALIREFMEPRLIGAKVGVYPVAILVAVYAGLRLFGLGGIFLGPIGLVMIQQVYGAYNRCIDGRYENSYDETEDKSS